MSRPDVYTTAHLVKLVTTSHDCMQCYKPLVVMIAGGTLALSRSANDAPHFTLALSPANHVRLASSTHVHYITVEAGSVAVKFASESQASMLNLIAHLHSICSTPAATQRVSLQQYLQRSPAALKPRSGTAVSNGSVRPASDESAFSSARASWV